MQLEVGSDNAALSVLLTHPIYPAQNKHRNLTGNPGAASCPPSIADVTYSAVHRNLSMPFCIMTCVVSRMSSVLTLITPDAVGLASTCQHLNLGMNSLASLGAGVLSGFESVTELTAEGIGLGVLGGGFEGLSQLASLHVGLNRISRIEADAFVGLSLLASLDLSGQPLEHVASGGFRGLSGLSTLYVRGGGSKLACTIFLTTMCDQLLWYCLSGYCHQYQTCELAVRSACTPSHRHSWRAKYAIAPPRRLQHLRQAQRA